MFAVAARVQRRSTSSRRYESATRDRFKVVRELATLYLVITDFEAIVAARVTAHSRIRDVFSLLHDLKILYILFKHTIKYLVYIYYTRNVSRLRFDCYFIENQ